MIEEKQLLNNEKLREMHGTEYVNTYEKKPLNRLIRLRKFFDLTKESIIVDFACGNAMLLEVLHDCIKEYHGVDFSTEMIASAKKRSEKLSFFNSYFYEDDINIFSNKNISRFDAAFAMDFSEHVLDDEWVKILSSIKKTLKLKGVLYLHTPNGEYFIEILKNKGILKQFPQHVAVRGAEHNLKLLIDAGFKIVKIDYLSHYEWRQKPFALLGVIPFIGKYFKARLFIKAETAIND
ncbi:MAG: class I SAM-dependent methyltransferase [Methylococcales bacterium]|nr:class I SAM-dependent methyltransferase [Methylococcales bacterium]